MKFRNKKGFTLAEALIMLLITALIIVATMPVITKKKRHRQDYKFGPPGGWLCTKEDLKKGPCHFKPPAKAKNFAFYFNGSLIPTFSARNIGEITIKKPDDRKTHEEIVDSYYVPPSVTVNTEEGYGHHDSSWGKYEQEHGKIQVEDKVTETENGGYMQNVYETVVDDEGGCKGTPELYTSIEDYTKKKIIMSGEFCSDAESIRIVY